MNCDKFEEFFIQENDDELLAHIKTCETCNREYNKMLATQKLIKEAKPYFKAKKKRKIYANVAACFVIAVVASTFLLNTNQVTKIAYDETVTGTFPLDEYGLLDIQ